MTAIELTSSVIDDTAVRGAPPRYPRVSLCTIADPPGRRRWARLVERSLRSPADRPRLGLPESDFRAPNSLLSFAWCLLSSDGRLVGVSAIAFDAPDLARRHARRVTKSVSRLVVARVASGPAALGWELWSDEGAALVSARMFSSASGRDRSLRSAQAALRIGDPLFDDAAPARI